MASSKAREILDELRSVLTGRAQIADAALPAIVFLAGHTLLGLVPALLAALAIALGLATLRLVRHQSLVFAISGMAGVAIAGGLAWFFGRAEGFFLPGLASSSMTVAACFVSVLVGRPLVALTSWFVRRWPFAWYAHSRIRPAYREVTLVWGLYFSARLALQLHLFRGGDVTRLGLADLLTDWPATIVLLIVSYLYGTWRLRQLAGPSVEEFQAGALPPWESQRRGF
jgi:hypothetical protein